VTGEAPREEGPTELVETEDGELLERLSGGTATLLLAWLIGVGGLSTLLAAWTYVWIVSGQRLGIDALFGGFGIYTSLAGAAGPCVLWLAGRAQNHALGWFMLTAAKIALVMIGVIIFFILAATLVMAGAVPGVGGIVAGALMAVMAVALSQIWAVTTWVADRWIARARVTDA
jgi:hypothetical protein